MNFIGSILLCILSAVFYVCSFPNFNLWFLGWIALVPFLFAIDGKNKTSSILLAYVFGLLFFACLSYWVNYVAYVSLKTFALLISYQALYFVIFGILANRILINKFPLFLEAILISAAWVALEFIRGHFLISFGSWGALAYSQADHRLLIQSADLAGYSGISFLMVMVNVLIKQLIGRRKAGIAFSFVLVLILFSANIIYGRISLNKNFQATEGVKVSVIQGNIPQSQSYDAKYKGKILRKYEYFTRLAAKEKPDLIVWPETAVPGYINAQPGSRQFISNLAKRMNCYILVGSARSAGLVKDYFNSAVLFSPDKGMETFYDKQRLVPFAEYDPVKKYSKLSKIIGLRADVHNAGMQELFYRAGIEPIIFNIQKARFGAYICVEDFYTAGAFIKNGANFLINITNDGWFGKSSGPTQHAEASVFRAVEYRMPLVRCSNTGVSEFIDVYGKTYGRVADSHGQYLMATGCRTDIVNFCPYDKFELSFYAKYEYWFAYLCLFLLLPIIIALLIRSNYPRPV